MESGSPNADGALLESNACVTYINVEIARDVGASVKAQGYVLAAICVVVERSIADGGIVPPDSVAKERLRTVGRVSVASQIEEVFGIAKKRSKTGGGIVNTTLIASEGLITISRVSRTQRVLI